MAAQFDAIVVGAGAAGSASALALAQRGWHVCLLDGGRRDQARVGETLSPLSRDSLEELKLWDEF